jgi:peptidoglycan/xylan/chitin deacetylase (PgdA/CDA1 family)
MQRHGMRGVIFAVTGWIGDGPARAHAGDAGASVPGTPNHRTCKIAISEGRADEVMMRWPEIEHVENAGVFEIHSHTHSHVRWDEKIPDAAERVAAVGKDLRDSQATLKSRLGRADQHLCWPWGHTEAGYSEAARAAGFEVEYLVEKGTCHPGTNPRQVPRIVVKDKAGGWFPNRMFLFSNRLLGGLYTRLRGK